MPPGTRTSCCHRALGWPLVFLVPCFQSGYDLWFCKLISRPFHSPKWILKMIAWDLFIGRHFLETVAAATKEEAHEVACFRLGRHLEGTLSIRVRSDGRFHPLLTPLGGFSPPR